MKNALLCSLLILGFTLSARSETKPKYGPAPNPRAIPLARANEYFKSKAHAAPDFWNLSGFYVPQINGYSCSAASVAMVLNAARVGLPKTADDKVILQEELLDRVKVEDWKERLSPAGAKGAHGMDLDRLRSAAEAAFRQFGFPKSTVEAIHLDDTSVASKKRVLDLLKKNERSADDFLIANFDQKAFTDDAEVGHLAPVGAFDEIHKRVLILDPDREYYEPYWVSVDDFIAGMATRDSGGSKNRGLIYIKLVE
jgi:hypothetical protein